MPANTTNKQITYPLAADKISDYPAIAKQSAETVDSALTALDPGPWTALTLGPGWTTATGGREPVARRIGNTVYIRGAVKGASPASFAKFATLPVNMRPGKDQHLGAQIGSVAAVGARIFSLYVDTAGVLSCPTGWSDFPTGTYNALNLDCSFPI